MSRRSSVWVLIPIFVGMVAGSILLGLVVNLRSSSASGLLPNTNANGYGPYICEALGHNGCWAPSVLQQGPPYMGFDTPRPPRTKTCTVKALHDEKKDDAPAIRDAFDDCRDNAHIIFENTTYHIASVLNTTGLRNVDIELKGTLKWNNRDINYWLQNSLPIGFQNQTSAWHLGGESIHFYGHGYGTFNGDGQVWYNYAHGRGNVHGRPHALTITDSKNSVIEGLNFYQAQMWTMTVIRSEQMLLQDINIANLCDKGKGTFPNCNINTDGVDTIYANNITFLRWQVENGDDGFSAKQNSTNIYFADSKLQSAACFAMGSIGQYPGQIELIVNITARNITCTKTRYGVFVKTWTGQWKGEPPNGGGGGVGYAKNMSFADLTLDEVDFAYHFEQNTSYNHESGGKPSKFRIEDVTLGPSHGTIRTATVGAFACSAAAPCTNITVVDSQITRVNGTAVDEYLCQNVINSTGFTCN